MFSFITGHPLSYFLTHMHVVIFMIVAYGTGCNLKTLQKSEEKCVTYHIITKQAYITLYCRV